MRQSDHVRDGDGEHPYSNVHSDIGKLLALGLVKKDNPRKLS